MLKIVVEYAERFLKASTGVNRAVVENEFMSRRYNCHKKAKRRRLATASLITMQLDFFTSHGF